MAGERIGVDDAKNGFSGEVNLGDPAGDDTGYGFFAERNEDDLTGN